MATETNMQIDPKIYDAANDPVFMGRKIYIDQADVNSPYKQRRYFETRGATIFSEPFVKNNRGVWVGEVSGNPGQGQRLILTVKGNWILNEYTLEEMKETQRGLAEQYPREYLSDSQDEFFEGMNKGRWGMAIKEEHYRLINGSEAELWLAKAGHDLESQTFRGVKFKDMNRPNVYAGTDEEQRKEERQRINMIEV